jgi:hypothetical protein
MEFSEVTVDDQGRGGVDMLGTEELEEGETIHVKWPDGSIEACVCEIDRSEQLMDDTHDCRAYVEVQYRGAEGRVYLRGSGIKISRE